MTRKQLFGSLAGFFAVFAGLLIWSGVPRSVHAQANRGPMTVQQDVVDGTVHAYNPTGSVLSDVRLQGSASSLAADNVGNATNTLANSGISFPIDASTTYGLECELYYTVGSGGGLTVALNGPASPTKIVLNAAIATAATTMNFNAVSTGTSWQTQVGTATSTVTTTQYAHVTGTVQNGVNAGTLALQYADVNTTGTTTLKAGSACVLQ